MAEYFGFFDWIRGRVRNAKVTGQGLKDVLSGNFSDGASNLGKGTWGTLANDTAFAPAAVMQSTCVLGVDGFISTVTLSQLFSEEERKKLPNSSELWNRTINNGMIASGFTAITHHRVSDYITGTKTEHIGKTLADLHGKTALRKQLSVEEYNATVDEVTEKISAVSTGHLVEDIVWDRHAAREHLRIPKEGAIRKAEFEAWVTANNQTIINDFAERGVKAPTLIDALRAYAGQKNLPVAALVDEKEQVLVVAYAKLSRFGVNREEMTRRVDDLARKQPGDIADSKITLLNFFPKMLAAIGSWLASWFAADTAGAGEGAPKLANTATAPQKEDETKTGAAPAQKNALTDEPGRYEVARADIGGLRAPANLPAAGSPTQQVGG